MFRGDTSTNYQDEIEEFDLPEQLASDIKIIMKIGSNNFKQGNTWRDTINTNQLKLGFCSIANNYYLNKSLTDAQLTAMVYAGK